MGKTILIVVKNFDISFTIETLLRKNGYNVIGVNNADDCLKELKKNRINLILIDGVGLVARTKILETAVKIKGLKIAYLIHDEYDEKDLKLYKNVVGFIDEPRNINNFLIKLKELLNQ
jgi:DNA-binding NtrC family response regulator